MFRAWARIVYDQRWGVLGASFLLLVVSLVGLARGGSLSSGLIEGIESERGLDAIEKGLGRPAGSTFTAIFTAPDWAWPEPRFVEAVRAALAPAIADARVLSVETPDDVPSQLAADWISKDGHRVIALVTLREPFRRAQQDYTAVHELIHGGPLDVLFTGYLPFKNDLDRTLEIDLIHAELVSVPLALVVLLMVFGTVVAAFLPIGVGGLAVVGGVAAVFTLAHMTDMAQYSINIVTLIGLGVAIDYSLFIVSRYRDELARGAAVEEALEITIATAGRAVAFSGIAVGIGLSGLLFYPRSYLSAMGLAGAIVVFLAVAYALTFLPALLAVLGPRIHGGRLPFRLGDARGVWRRIAHAVMARPVAVLVPTLAIMLVFGYPFLDLRIAATDVRALPPSVEARRGQEILAAELPAQAANRVVVVVNFPTEPALTADRVGALYELSRRIGALPGVLKVESVVDLDSHLTRPDYQILYRLPSGLRPEGVRYAERMTVGRQTVLLSAVTVGTPESDAARDVVRAIRSERQVGDGTLLVTGQTANDLDSTSFIIDHTPLAIGFVMAMTYIVLLLALGSVLLPLKAVLMNLISISASFGALVWIFQEGHFAGILGFEPRALDPTLPVLLFCSVFGLSMDYEVLLLTRMQEEYERSGDNTRAVAEGLERSGRLITSAAAIMVSVFVAFALARVVVVKAMGFGMALAVALDATLVRVLIVPSAMRLFGDLNWWAPARLKRWLGHD